MCLVIFLKVTLSSLQESSQAPRIVAVGCLRGVGGMSCRQGPSCCRAPSQRAAQPDWEAGAAAGQQVRAGTGLLPSASQALYRMTGLSASTLKPLLTWYEDLTVQVQQGEGPCFKN